MAFIASSRAELLALSGALASLPPVNRMSSLPISPMKRETSQGISSLPCLRFAVADVQRTPRAGDADVHQAALFLDLVRCLRFAVRQYAFFNADQEYVLELQALGGVQRRQLDGIKVAILLVEQG